MGLEFFEPQTLEEALALGGRWGEQGSFIAGGTDLVIQMRRGRKDPGALISLLRLQELQGISTEGARITLGGLTTHRDIERHPAFQCALFAMVEAAQVIGGHQVRNAGTVAGNLCNASPAADLLPVLLVLDADVHLSGLQGERDISIAGFLQGPGRTARTPGELLTHVSFDKPDARTGTSFLKSGRRRAMEISIVSVAASVTLDEGGGWKSARVAVGAAAPTAIRIPAVEAMLKGAVGAQQLAQAGRDAAAAVSPLDDARASATYRRQLVETLVQRALAVAQERAGKP
jgi:carbon-monoxide dehydrogenase medium subunit